MRLIDADKLRKEIHMSYSDDLGIREVIDEQMTAFDVDKVMNMLKEKAEHAENKAAEYDEQGNASMMDIWDAEAKSYRNAIEIVKSGCVADE